MQKQILDQIILQLKQIEVDGESMEYIVPSIGVGFLTDFKTKLYYENRT